MKRIGFAYNPTQEGPIGLRKRAVAWCRGHAVDSWEEEAANTDALLANLPGTDVLVVLGGDGTFLRAARALARIDVPVIGVNAGKVGFLSKAESEHLEEVLGQLERAEYKLEPRMMLETWVVHGGREVAYEGPAEVHVALNEAAIVRGAQARVVRLELSVDDSHVGTYIADGIVVASPTGSTGYSSSAGGPILDPTARNLVVTPIAGYLAAIRSIVVGPQHTVTVRVIEAHDCLVSVDGREEMSLRVGDSVFVRARERPIRFVEPRDALPFWDLLRRKAELLPH